MSRHEYTEADMCAPVREYLTGLGYRVRTEVKGCDIAAEYAGELVVVELKKSFGLRLVYQALDRLALTGQVYAAIPRPKDATTAQYRGMLRLMKRLELGLMTVAMDSPVRTVEVLVYPESAAKARRSAAKKASLLKEITCRRLDMNTGGVRRRKIMTAYRERCVKVACILKSRGPKRVKELEGEYGCEGAARILQRNFDGWFERVETGVYRLSARGEEYLAQADALTEYYMRVYG